MGLSMFTLGYVYRVFAKQVAQDSKFAEVCKEEHKSMLLASERDCRDKARKCF